MGEYVDGHFSRDFDIFSIQITHLDALLSSLLSSRFSAPSKAFKASYRFSKNINCSKDIFSLMHINARSINKNIETIYQMLSSLRVSFDIIGISETWISEPNDLIQIEDYKFICNGRKNRKGSGVGLYIKDDKNYKVRKDLGIHNEDIMESLFIEIINEKNKIIAGIIYRAPDSDVKCFLERITEITAKINLENKKCYLLGDFNIDLLGVNNSGILGEFLVILYSSFFKPLIGKPTRITKNTVTLIDNIFTNVFFMTRLLALMDYFVLIYLTTSLSFISIK